MNCLKKNYSDKKIRLYFCLNQHNYFALFYVYNGDMILIVKF